MIPEEQLLPLVLAHGSSGLQLDFTYQSRDTPEMVIFKKRFVDIYFHISQIMYSLDHPHQYMYACL